MQLAWNNEDGGLAWRIAFLLDVELILIARLWEHETLARRLPKKSPEREKLRRSIRGMHRMRACIWSVRDIIAPPTHGSERSQRRAYSEAQASVLAEANRLQLAMEEARA